MILNYWQEVNALWLKLDPETAEKARMNAVRLLLPKTAAARCIPWELRSAPATRPVWVCSQRSPYPPYRSTIEGRIFVVPPYLAAQLIVGSTHRLATKREIAAWKRQQKRPLQTTTGLTAVLEPRWVRYLPMGWEPAKPEKTPVGLIGEGLAQLWRRFLDHPRWLLLYRPSMKDFDSDRFWKLSPAERRKCREWAGRRILRDLDRRGLSLWRRLWRAQ